MNCPDKKTKIVYSVKTIMMQANAVNYTYFCSLALVLRCCSIVKENNVGKGQSFLPIAH